MPSLRILSLAKALLALALAGGAKPSQARPDHGLSTRAEAMAGGGAAAEGAALLAVNPAAIAAGGGWEAEAGWAGSTELEPYALYRGSNLRSAHAFQIQARPRAAEWTGGALWLGYALPLFPGPETWRQGPWLGLALRAESREEELAVDADLGLLWRRGPWRAGAALRRVLENGFDSQGNPAPRQGQAGLGADWVLPGAVLSADYDFLAPGFSPAEGAHCASLGGSTGRGHFQWRLATRFPAAGGDMAWAAGAALRYPRRLSLLEMRYALSAPSAENPFQGLAHGISLGFQWLPFRDPLPPKVRVRAEPNAPGEAGFSFLMAVEDNLHRPRNWKLEVRAARGDGRPGDPVYSLSGPGLPPGALRWKAEDAAGIPLPPGAYLYRLRAEDADGNAAHSPWLLLEIPADPG